jgi:hypothetical protein
VLSAPPKLRISHNRATIPVTNFGATLISAYVRTLLPYLSKAVVRIAGFARFWVILSDIE